jgi:hypothetical protein
LTICLIRIRWTLWLTPGIEAELAKLEAALRKMGAENILLDGMPVGQARSATVERLYILFSDITGANHWDEKVEKRNLSDAVRRKLREVLGTAELTSLRTHFVKRALNNLEE